MQRKLSQDATAKDSTSPALTLPLAGRFHVSEWAKLLDIEQKTLMENMQRARVRFIRYGRTIIIDAEIFWFDLGERPYRPLREEVAVKTGLAAD